MVTMIAVKKYRTLIHAFRCTAAASLLMAAGCMAPAPGPASPGITTQPYAAPVEPAISLAVKETAEPTVDLSPESTEVPTETPTQVPTEIPTEIPTDVPPEVPTDVPTEAPTEAPAVLPTATPAPVDDDESEPPAQPYLFSPLYDGLAAGYGETLATERFLLHYTAGTLPAEDPQHVADFIMAALLHHEQLLGVTLDGSFDIYAAGTLFAAPDQALRGRSFSANRRTFFLYDGTGSPAEQAYIAAHELTHLLAWNTLGAPSSVMLSEGTAVYAGMDFVRGGELLPLRDFCAWYWQAGALPRVSQDLDFLGHIRNLENYYSAGCFVEFLIERYGAPAFGNLYATGSYGAVYGKSLLELEEEWLADLAQYVPSFAYPPVDLVAAVEQVEEIYGELFAAFDGTPEELARYRALDRARMALLTGQLHEVQLFYGQ